MEDEQDWLLNAGNLYFDQGPHSDFAVARLDYVWTYYLINETEWCVCVFTLIRSECYPCTNFNLLHIKQGCRKRDCN